MLYHIVGESYVDLLCYLQAALPKQSEDSVLVEPLQTLAGGSTVNTATHLRELVRSSNNRQDSRTQQVVVQTVLNPNDEYGTLLHRHCAEHDIPIINCYDDDDDHNHHNDETNQGDNHKARSSSTPHCVVMVSEGDRSFMTHRGCAEQFTGRHVRLPHLWDHDGPVTLHVAGWYCTPGFGRDGRDGSLVEAIRRLRRERHARWPQYRTVVSAVAQFDVQQQWDGGIDDLVPHLQFLILNQVEVHKIVQRAKGTLHSGDDEIEYTVRDWMSFFASLSTETVVVVFRGAEGAIAFRGERLIGDTGPAVAVSHGWKNTVEASAKKIVRETAS